MNHKNPDCFTKTNDGSLWGISKYLICYNNNKKDPADTTQPMEAREDKKLPPAGAWSAPPGPTAPNTQLPTPKWDAHSKLAKWPREGAD